MIKNIKTESGQGLLETIVAIFVLITAISAGIGLSIYIFSHSQTNLNEIVATNLAREGIEVVHTMRDTNWLMGDSGGGAINIDPDCGTGAGGQNAASEDPMDGKACYNFWRNPLGGFDISSSTYYLNVDPANNLRKFTLGSPAGQNSRFAICYGVSGSNLYGQCSDAVNPPAVPPFARAIRISDANTSAPYTPRNPLILVESVVVWSEKGCPSIVNENPLSLATNCKITTQEYLANWKDY